MADIVDKNQAVIDFLIACPNIHDNPLYFNLINAQDDAKQFITSSNDIATMQRFIDGSVLKTYTFTLIDFKSVTFNPVVKLEDYQNENVYDMANVQEIITWINEQAELRNYPDFGPDCVVENMQVTTENPTLNYIDASMSPPLAKYSFTIRIDYLDKSKMLWN